MTCDNVIIMVTSPRFIYTPYNLDSSHLTNVVTKNPRVEALHNSVASKFYNTWVCRIDRAMALIKQNVDACSRIFSTYYKDKATKYH